MSNLGRRHVFFFKFIYVVCLFFIALMIPWITNICASISYISCHSLSLAMCLCISKYLVVTLNFAMIHKLGNCGCVVYLNNVVVELFCGFCTYFSYGSYNSLVRLTLHVDFKWCFRLKVFYIVSCCEFSPISEDVYFSTSMK